MVTASDISGAYEELAKGTEGRGHSILSQQKPQARLGVRDGAGNVRAQRGRQYSRDFGSGEHRLEKGLGGERKEARKREEPG